MDNIRGYIEQESSDAADRVVSEIFCCHSRVGALSPSRPETPPDLTSRPLHFILVRKYLIAYAPDEKPLWVVAVIHGRRSPCIMSAILRGREQPSQGSILKAMEVHFTPEQEAQLAQITTNEGTDRRTAGEGCRVASSGRGCSLSSRCARGYCPGGPWRVEEEEMNARLEQMLRR